MEYGKTSQPGRFPRPAKAASIVNGGKNTVMINVTITAIEIFSVVAALFIGQFRKPRPD
jgi:hypothetical protein